MKSMRAKLFNVLKILISVGMLAYVLLVRVDLRELGNALLQARWGFLVVAALLAMAGVALRAVRWLALLRALDIAVPLGRLVKLYFVGTFFNIFLLSGFGGDAIRMMELARHSKKTPEAIGTVLVDRATGLWVLFVLGLIALPFGRASIPQETAALVATVSVVGVPDWNGNGIVSRAFAALGTQGTRVIAVAQAATEYSVSFCIPEEQVTETVCFLHRELGLEGR